MVVEECAASCRDKKRRDKNNLIDIYQTDVLLGRGKSYKNHPGNIQFQVIINENRKLYFEAKSHREKREITIDVVEAILENGRFLKLDNHTWKEATFETARQKVAHAMQYRQRCSIASTTRHCFESAAGNAENVSRTIEPQIFGETAKNIYFTFGSVADLSSMEPDASKSGHIDLHSATTIEEYPTSLRIVSDVIGIQIAKPAFGLEACSTCNSTSKKCFCSEEHDRLSKLLRISQMLNPMEISNETLPTKHLSDVQIPPPINSLIRGTSDFSFGDFSFTVHGGMTPTGDDYRYDFEND